MPVSTAWDAGVRPGATLLSLNGVPAADVDRAPPSLTSLRVRSSSGDVISASVVDELVTEGRVKFSLWVLGALFAVLGSVVLLRRPDLNSARWFAGFAGAAAVALAVGPASAGPAPPWALIVQFFSLIGIGFTCLPFVATLVLDGYRPRRSRLVGAFAAVAVALTLGYSYAVTLLPVAYEFVRPVFLLYVAGSLLGSMVVLTLRSRPKEAFEMRRHSRVALFGIAAGTLPFVGLTVIPEVVASQSLVPGSISVLTGVLIPLSFAYAITQYNFLGIRRLVHRGMVNILTTVATFVVLIAALSVFESMAVDLPGGGRAVPLQAAILTLGVGAFFLLRRSARKLVDRLFYREIAQYDDFVDLVRSDQLAIGSAGDVIDGIAARIVETLRLESVLLFLGDGPDGARLLTATGPRSDEVVSKIYPERASQIRESHGSDMLDLRWESESLLVMALKSPGRQIGFAILGPKTAGEVFLEEEKRLALTVGPLLAMAVDQSILSNDLRELNQRLVGAQEMERKRMAADVHDGPLQKAIVLTRPRDGALMDPEELAKELVRELREVCSRLRPSIIDDLGLFSGLEWLLDGVSDRTDLLTSLSLIGLDEDDRFDPDSELTLFRITQESINNTLKHANATRIDVSLCLSADELILMAIDDGVGFSFSPHRAGGAATLESGGVGLSGMRERVIHINGSLEISSSPGKGTTVMARIPAHQAQSRIGVEA